MCRCSCPGAKSATRTKKPSKVGITLQSTRQVPLWKGRVHMDFLGPLPKTPRGNEYVFMLVDQFNKWVACIPLPSQTAEVTAKAVVNGFFSRFVTSFEICSD